MELKAIETYYKGYKFRSRLEARWAVFLDACGADWEYEQEGYWLPDGSRYLPDFKVKNVKGRARDATIFIEVKGTLTDKDLRKIEMFAGNYCPRKYPDHFACNDCPLEKRCVYREIEGRRILIVGAIPDPDNYREYIRDLWDQAGNPNGQCFYNLYLIDEDWFPAVLCVDKNGGLHLDDDNYNYFDGVDEGLTSNAYRMARQARFEYGETPSL